MEPTVYRPAYHWPGPLGTLLTTKPSNGSELRWVNPGPSSGWVGFVGLGDAFRFLGLGWVPESSTRVTQRTQDLVLTYFPLHEPSSPAR